MRYVPVLLLGALLGAVFTAMTLNALRQASAVPDGVMAVMQYHQNTLRRLVSEQRCDQAQTQPHFQTLLSVAGDIEPVFVPTGGDDVLFARYASQLHSRLNEALAQPATDCKRLSEQVGRVGDGCAACHRDFKS